MQETPSAHVTAAAATTPAQMPELSSTIHPADEMYLFIANHPALRDNALERYFQSGQAMVVELETALAALGTQLGNVRRFLEFACGYGRFTRHLVRHLEPSRITVSDLYKEAVDFQKETFGVNGFYSELVPEQLVDRGEYDVIFVGSLFSHLPEAVWEPWIKRLYQLLAPRGALIFSTHGPTCLPKGAVMAESGFLFNRHSESSIHSVDDYGSTYVTPEYVRDAVRSATGQPVAWDKHKGLYSFQDLYAVQKP